MILELSSLKPNPLRDFRVDPIDNEDDESLGHVSAVTQLKESIEEDGFWGGVVARKVGDTYEIAAGHHRVEAAIAAGLTEADIVVLSMDNAAMVRVYARENATQRGSMSTAVTGSVAAALRFVAKQAFIGADEFISTSKFARKEQPIGRPAIMEVLRRVPAVTENSVNQQLAILKSSGDYARIIGEVEAEIEEENRRALEHAEELRREAEELKRKRRDAEAARKRDEAKRAALDEKIRAAKEEEERTKLAEDLKAAEEQAERNRVADALNEKRQKDLEEESKAFAPTVDASTKATETAKKAAEKASHKTRTFDYEGVSKYLRTDNQVRAFREWATGPGITPYLPVDSQHLIAKALAEHALENERELSAAFIKQFASELLSRAKVTGKQKARETQDAMDTKALDDKARHWQAEFSRNCRGMVRAGTELNTLSKAWPKSIPFPITTEFRTALADASNVINALHKEINNA